MNFETVEDTWKYIGNDQDGMDVIEFGVFNGNSLIRILNGYKQNNVSVGAVWGFDSFEGLPDEDPNVWHNEEWPRGAFNVQKDFGLKSVDEAEQWVWDRITKEHDNISLYLVPGFFSETLRDSIDYPQSLSAGYIHIDADIYSSSMEALDFCFKNHVLAPACIIRFDDIASTPTNAGQHLAWTKTKQRYAVEYEQLSYNVFRILNYD